jgi:release factor glutamine methyltransferase
MLEQDPPHQNAKMPEKVRAQWQAEVRRLIALMEMHETPYLCNVGELEITIFPQVFSPRYFTDCEWFAVEVSKIVGSKTFFEVGVGSGIVALKAALNGARVSGCDLNPHAVKNTEFNFSKHGVNGKFFHGSVFQPLKVTDRFDVIFWNHPFNRGSNPNETPLALCGFDFNYNGLREFIQNGHRYLNNDGKLLLGSGSFAEIESIIEFAAEVGLSCNAIKSATYPLEQGGHALTEFTIYEIN